MLTIDGTSLQLILAQTNEPFSLGGDSPAQNGTQQPGEAGGGRPTGDPLGPQFFIIVLVVLGGMILFSMLAQRRDRKKREAMLTTLKKHDKVQTIGGVIGSIVDVKKDVVVLKVDESSNTRITFSRSAIQQVFGGSEAAAPAAPPAVDKA
ncbi:MAG: preprotein translocase subunit YajC [Planctomycetota bacterium]|jgi:preprotein translocase subunit YajC